MFPRSISIDIDPLISLFTIHNYIYMVVYIMCEFLNKGEIVYGI
jgi:hypothetical protein